MKDPYCAYYTESPAIVSFMVSQLKVCSGDRILEPAAGSGIFIDALLVLNRPFSLDALEYHEEAAYLLQKKYHDHPNIHVRATDTLFDEKLDRRLGLNSIGELSFALPGVYDKVIANPPYGAWQDYEKRTRLKRKYPNYYVKETYALFLLRALSALKMGGRLVCILPDTFLYLRRHQALRQTLFTHAKVESLVVFPARYFPGLQFGYAKLCIVTLERVNAHTAQNHMVSYIEGFSCVKELSFLSKVETHWPAHIHKKRFTQALILRHPLVRFFADERVEDALNSNNQTIADVAHVVTGFCTGDNRKYLQVRSTEVPYSKGYDVVDPATIVSTNSLDGVDAAVAYVPYVKAAPRTRFSRAQDDWFLRWDCKTVNRFRVSKKTRMQNTRFYFMPGIGIPMVKSRELRAFLFEGRIFDQAIVGIFPKEEKNRFYLFALFNSRVMHDLLRSMNPSANNSANYVKALPYIEPSMKVRTRIDRLIAILLAEESSLRTSERQSIEREIDSLIASVYAK